MYRQIRLVDKKQQKKKLRRVYSAFFFCLCFSFSHTEPRGLPAGQLRTESGLEEAAILQEATEPLAYKGVVMADINPENTYKDELIVDFGNQGIWVYEQMTWHQVSEENPDWIIAVSLDDDPASEVVVDFGIRGLWRWSHSGYPGNWSQVSGDDALWAVGLDDDGDGRQELHVNFGPDIGLWRYDEDAGGEATWTQISNLSPTWGFRTDMSPAGKEEGCYLFPGNGVWTITWSGKEAGHRQLTGNEIGRPVFASASFIGSEGEDLVLEFKDKGAWLCQAGDYQWYQISKNSPARMTAARSGSGGARLIIDFEGGRGISVWNYAGYPGHLARLHHADPGSGFCVPFDPDGRTEKTGEQELAIDFGQSGLWKYDFSRRTWTLLNTKNPEFMVAGDYWNEGSQATLAVDFGPDGLWLYEGHFGGWFKISANSPDQK